MGHSRLLSKLANLLRKTRVKIGWADTRRPPAPSPRGKGPDEGRLAAILALLSLLLPADRKQHVAACLWVMGLALNARAEQDWMEDKGGHQKPSFIWMSIERWQGTMRD